MCKWLIQILSSHHIQKKTKNILHHRLKVRAEIIKHLRENEKEYPNGLSLKAPPKAQFIKEKIDKLDFLKLKKFTFQKIPLRRLKDKPQTKRKYLQIIYLLKDWYTEYTKNSCNWIIRIQTT